MSLNDKVALVLGGSGVLGSSLARRLAEEGSKVYVTYHSAGLANVSGDLPSTVEKIRADVTDEPQVADLFDKVTLDSRRLDILVNCVGGYLPQKSLKDVSVAEWDHMMNINLKTTFLSTREALRRMAGQSYGRIINITAMIAFRPLPERIPYIISKASVALLTELVAQEVKGSGITVNAIAPGTITTAAELASMPGEKTSQGVTPEQIGDVIISLCSSSASIVSGTTIRTFRARQA